MERVSEPETYRTVRLGTYVVYFGWGGSYEDGIVAAWQVLGHATPHGHPTPEAAVAALAVA